MTDRQPIGAYATIKWLNDDEIVDGYYFSFGDCAEFNEETGDYGTDSYGVDDSAIFFYCDGECSLMSYMTEGVEGFIVISYELEYDQDDYEIERANLNNELEHNK
jgi:hypothetical protein